MWRRGVFVLRLEPVRDIEVEPGSVIPEPAVLKMMLVAGAGIGVLPDFHAEDALADGRLVRLLPHLKGRAVEVHALYPSHRSLSAKVRVFIDALLVHFEGRPSLPDAPGGKRPRSRATR